MAKSRLESTPQRLARHISGLQTEYSGLTSDLRQEAERCNVDGIVYILTQIGRVQSTLAALLLDKRVSIEEGRIWVEDLLERDDITVRLLKEALEEHCACQMRPAHIEP